MKIAIDIDDVLLQNTKALIKFLEEKGFNLKYEDFKSRRLWEFLDCTKKQSDNLIIDYYHSKQFANMELMPGADKALSNLSEKFDLVVVTNRPDFTKKTTLSLLNQYFGNSIKDVIFLGQFQKELQEESKKKKILEDKVKCSYCIEDDPDIAKQLDKTKIKTILFAHPWNKDEKDTIRLSNWNQIERYLLNDRPEWHEILVDVSQKDKSIFGKLKILGQKKSSNDKWILLKVGVPDEKLDKIIKLLQKNMSPGEFYFHFYRDDDLIVVFRKKIFRIKTDKSTWKEAVEYGKSLGIPERQLDFYPCRVEDEIY